MNNFLCQYLKRREEENTIHYSRSLFLNDELSPTPITQKNQCQKKDEQ